VADDQVHRAGVTLLPAQGTVCRGGKGEQDALFAKAFGKHMGACAGHDQAGGRTTEQTLELGVTPGPWHEHHFADLATRCRSGRHDAAYGLVTRHQWIPHTGKVRHVPRPEQAFGAGTYAAPAHLHDDVLVGGRDQFDLGKAQSLGLFEYDSRRIHGPENPFSWLV
jgi:hypothetical protein